MIPSKPLPLLRALALIVPLAGLGALWIGTHVRAQQGTEWQVPVDGYDPRDLLRGHYITYRYDWPGLAPAGDAAGQPFLCLEGRPPVIGRVRPGHGPDGGSSLPGPDCAQPVLPDADGNLAEGRLYVPQDKAAGLEEKLRDPALQGVVTIRLRADGRFTPLRIAFRPRPPEQ